MRLLLGDGDPNTPDGLRALYAPLRLPWLRANMVGSVDGAATGSDGRSGTVNNPVDVEVFATIRELADVILVGAGTARIEAYAESDRPIVVVSKSGEVPERLRDASPGAVRLATVATAPGLDEARKVLGDQHVHVVGETAVDARALLGILHGEGLSHVVCEGGPTLLGALLHAGVVDELCHTQTPRVLAGDGGRIVAAPALDVRLGLHMLLEHEGTLLGRWLVDG